MCFVFPFPRAKAALNLETQIENTDKIVSTFEAKLAQDSIIPASPNALQDRANDLQVGEHQASSSGLEIPELREQCGRSWTYLSTLRNQ